MIYDTPFCGEPYTVYSHIMTGSSHVSWCPTFKRTKLLYKVILKYILLQQMQRTDVK